MNTPSRRTIAFTLVELIVVITILAILGTIAFASFQGVTRYARNSARAADLSLIRSSLELFVSQWGRYPLPT
jgi:prepilin-type N-terminal cleavage/methylation domain-containing protein